MNAVTSDPAKRLANMARGTPPSPGTPKTNPDLLTVREVADALRVDDTTVRRWIKEGKMPAISLPHLGYRQVFRIQQRVVDMLLAQGDDMTSSGSEQLL